MVARFGGQSCRVHAYDPCMMHSVILDQPSLLCNCVASHLACLLADRASTATKCQLTHVRLALLLLISNSSSLTVSPAPLETTVQRDSSLMRYMSPGALILDGCLPKHTEASFQPRPPHCATTALSQPHNRAVDTAVHERPASLHPEKGLPRPTMHSMHGSKSDMSDMGINTWHAT